MILTWYGNPRYVFIRRWKPKNRFTQNRWNRMKTDGILHWLIWPKILRRHTALPVITFVMFMGQNSVVGIPYRYSFIYFLPMFVITIIMIDIALIILLILSYFIEMFCVIIHLIFYDLCLVMLDQCILTFYVLICNSINVFFYVYLSDYECSCVAKNALVSLSCVFYQIHLPMLKKFRLGRGLFFLPVAQNY